VVGSAQVEQGLQRRFQLASIFLAEVQEPERLQQPLSPTSENNIAPLLRTVPGADVKHDFHLDSFIQRLLQGKQSTRDRHLMSLALTWRPFSRRSIGQMDPASFTRGGRREA